MDEDVNPGTPNRSKKTVIWVILILLLILLLAAGYFIFSRDQDTDIDELTPTPTDFFENSSEQTINGTNAVSSPTNAVQPISPSPTIQVSSPPVTPTTNPTPTSGNPGDLQPITTNTPTPTGFSLSN